MYIYLSVTYYISVYYNILYNYTYIYIYVYMYCWRGQVYDTHFLFTVTYPLGTFPGML